MLGDTIDIKADERRYNELINQGMLPSASIKKIETDKRLGVGIKPKGETDWNITTVKIAIVGLSLYIVYSIVKKRISPVTPSPAHSLSIDNIQGIDLRSLAICRQNNLL